MIVANTLAALAGIYITKRHRFICVTTWQGGTRATKTRDGAGCGPQLAWGRTVKAQSTRRIFVIPIIHKMIPQGTAGQARCAN